jgi:hypothetical protein
MFTGDARDGWSDCSRSKAGGLADVEEDWRGACCCGCWWCWRRADGGGCIASAWMVVYVWECMRGRERDAWRCGAVVVVVRGWVWCCRVSGGGDAGKAAACDLSLAQALAQGVHSAKQNSPLPAPGRERRQQAGGGRAESVQSSRSPPEQAVAPSGPIAVVQ